VTRHRGGAGDLRSVRRLECVECGPHLPGRRARLAGVPNCRRGGACRGARLLPGVLDARVRGLNRATRRSRPQPRRLDTTIGKELNNGQRLPDSTWCVGQCRAVVRAREGRRRTVGDR
jgi:hypothetical protein